MRRIVALGVVAAAAAAAVWTIARSASPLPPVDVTASVEHSADTKVQAFAAARARAEATGRPVAVTETFSDAELSWLANRAAEDRDEPVQDIVLHATGNGIQAQAEATAAGQTVPVSVTGVPRVAGNRISFEVTAVRIGSLPLPAFLLDRLPGDLRGALEAGGTLSGFSQIQLSTTNGSSTLSAVAEPTA